MCFFKYKTLTLISIRGFYYQSEGWERISAPPGHVISQGLAPGARVVTRGGSGSGGGGGGGGGGESLESIF